MAIVEIYLEKNTQFQIYFCATFSHPANNWKLRNYPREKIFETTRKNYRPTKYPRQKTLDPRNTHEKKFGSHEINKRKYFGSTKHPWGTVARWHEIHETHDGTRPTKFSTLLVLLCPESPSRKQCGTSWLCCGHEKSANQRKGQI